MSQEIEYSEKYYDDEFEYRCFATLNCALQMPLSSPPRRRRTCSCIEPSLTRRRHVILPKHVAKNSPKGRLLAETEWRGLGVQQSRGWVHYAIHR